jgi:hypothetical protein
MATYKEILFSIIEVLESNPYLMERVRRIFPIKIEPSLISQFPALSIYWEAKVETPETMPVHAGGWRRETDFVVQCWQKYMQREVVRVGYRPGEPTPEEVVAFYDFVSDVEDTLRSASSLHGQVLWSVLFSTTPEIEPFGETAFLASGQVRLRTLEKISGRP